MATPIGTWSARLRCLMCGGDSASSWGTDLVVAHNGQEFDVPVLRRACGGLEGFDDLVFYDTLPLARAVVDGSVKLKYLAERYNIAPGREHHALDDAVVLAAVVPKLNELRMRRARTVALVHLLDQLGLALALDQQSSPSKEEALFREITRPFTLGRYSDCLDIYAAELAAGAEGSARPGGGDRATGWTRSDGALRADRPVNERYPDSVERLRMLIQASAGGPSPSTSTTCCAGWRSRAAKGLKPIPTV